MKKIYEQPSAQIVEFESERIMDSTGTGETPSISVDVEDGF